MDARLILMAAGFAVAVALAVALRWLRGRYLLVTVSGRSMEPALRHGDRVLTRRRTVDELRLGDVVALRPPAPDGPSHPPTADLLIKRVVVIPGGVVPPAAVPPRNQWAGRILPAGLFVVRGDRAEISHDSRQLGPVPGDLLIGPVVRILTARPGMAPYRGGERSPGAS